MTTRSHPYRRPWYCSDQLTNAYKTIGEHGGDLRMLQALKIFRWITLNLMVSAVAVFAIVQGADPTFIGGAALVTFGLVNGIEWTEYAAARQALQEIEFEAGGDDAE